MGPRPRVEKPLAKVPPSERGYKVIYVKEKHKQELAAAAEAAGFKVLEDYLMEAHRVYQAQKKGPAK